MEISEGTAVATDGRASGADNYYVGLRHNLLMISLWDGITSQ
jgi:hypothetical protein